MFKKTRKIISVFMTSLLVVALLVGCSNGEKTSGGKASGAAEVLFWAPFSGPDGPNMKKIVEEYNKSQDKYKVKFQILPASEYYKTVDLAFNGKQTTPDVLILHGDQIVNYSKKGVLKNLDEIMGDVVKREDYHPNALKGAEVDGTLYGIPLDIHPLMFYWNKDLFKAAGLDPEKPPTTREEFIEYAKKLTNLDKQQYGYVVPTLWPQQFILPTIVYQNGGELMKDGKINYTSPDVVEALQFQHDLIFKHKVSPKDVQQDGELTLFLQGKNAMHLNGPWMMNQFEESGLNYGVAPVPQLGTKQQAVYANSHNFVIPEKTDEKKLEAVTDFLNYVANNGMAWAESGMAPASKAVYTSAEFQQFKQQPQVAKQFDIAQYAPQVENWGQLGEPLWNAVNVALLGKQDPQKALEEAQKKAEERLK